MIYCVHYSSYSLCIMCVQYIGGGDSVNPGEYHEYIRGYHEYIGGTP